MQKLGIYNKAPSKKKEYEPKLYQQMTYPGERVQIDMKYVPAKNLTEEVKEIVNRINQLEPDIILLGGDIIDDKVHLVFYLEDDIVIDSNTNEEAPLTEIVSPWQNIFRLDQTE